MPYLFADQWRLLRREASPNSAVDTAARPYRLFLYALATVPALGLVQGFAAMQCLYAVTAAAFMPILASTLLVLSTAPPARGSRRAAPLYGPWRGGLSAQPDSGFG